MSLGGAANDNNNTPGNQQARWSDGRDHLLRRADCFQIAFGGAFHHRGILCFDVIPEKKRRGPTAGTNLVYKVHQAVNISFLGLGSNICDPFSPADLTCLLCARPGLFWIFSWTLCFFSLFAASFTHPAVVLALSEPRRGGAVFAAGALRLLFRSSASIHVSPHTDLSCFLACLAAGKTRYTPDGLNPGTGGDSNGDADSRCLLPHPITSAVGL